MPEPATPESMEFRRPADQFQLADVYPAFAPTAQRLRLVGYGPEDVSIDADNTFVWKFQRNWKAITWVVLSSFDGSLAYRLPTEYFNRANPFFVIDVENLPDTATDAERDRLRAIRWQCQGAFPTVVDAVLNLPDLPGHSHFPSP